MGLSLPNREVEGPGPGVNAFIVASIDEEYNAESNVNETKPREEVSLRSALLLELVVSPVLARITNTRTGNYNWTGHLAGIISALNKSGSLNRKHVAYSILDSSGSMIHSKMRITATVPALIYARSESRTPDFDAYVRQDYSSSAESIQCGAVNLPILFVIIILVLTSES